MWPPGSRPRSVRRNGGAMPAWPTSSPSMACRCLRASPPGTEAGGLQGQTSAVRTLIQHPEDQQHCAARGAHHRAASGFQLVADLVHALLGQAKAGDDDDGKARGPRPGCPERKRASGRWPRRSGRAGRREAGELQHPARAQVAKREAGPEIQDAQAENEPSRRRPVSSSSLSITSASVEP